MHLPGLILLCLPLHLDCAGCFWLSTYNQINLPTNIGHTMNISHFQANTKQLITKADLGKVYIDMQGNSRTIDKRIVGEALVAYVVTNKWGKSEIVAK